MGKIIYAQSLPDGILKCPDAFEKKYKNLWEAACEKLRELDVLRPANAVIEDEKITITCLSLWKLAIYNDGSVVSLELKNGTWTDNLFMERWLPRHPIEQAREFLVCALEHACGASKYAFGFDVGDYDKFLSQISRLLFGLSRSLLQFRNDILQYCPWMNDRETISISEMIFGHGLKSLAATNLLYIYRNKEIIQNIVKTHGNLWPLLRIVRIEAWGRNDLFSDGNWLSEKPDIHLKNQWQTLTADVWNSIKSISAEAVQMMTIFSDFFDFGKFFKFCPDPGLAYDAMFVMRNYKISIFSPSFIPSEYRLIDFFIEEEELYDDFDDMDETDKHYVMYHLSRAYRLAQIWHNREKPGYDETSSRRMRSVVEFLWDNFAFLEKDGRTWEELEDMADKNCLKLYGRHCYEPSRFRPGSDNKRWEPILGSLPLCGAVIREITDLYELYRAVSEIEDYSEYDDYKDLHNSTCAYRYFDVTRDNGRRFIARFARMPSGWMYLSLRPSLAHLDFEDWDIITRLEDLTRQSRLLE